jgi:hypothetical protein
MRSRGTQARPHARPRRLLAPHCCANPRRGCRAATIRDGPTRGDGSARGSLQPQRRPARSPRAPGSQRRHPDRRTTGHRGAANQLRPCTATAADRGSGRDRRPLAPWTRASRPPPRGRRGKQIGRVDIWYEQAKLAVEYDGEWHRHNLADDNRRQNLLFSQGVRLLRFTARMSSNVPTSLWHRCAPTCSNQSAIGAQLAEPGRADLQLARNLQNLGPRARTGVPRSWPCPGRRRRTWSPGHTSCPGSAGR